jgi:hypothetical protein
MGKKGQLLGLLVVLLALASTANRATGQIHLWSERYGDTARDRGHCVTVDASGNVLVTGVFKGTVDFGGGALTSAGDHDIFLAKYDANGSLLWSQRFGGTEGDAAHSVDTDGSGNVFVTGSFQGSADFGGGPLTSAGGRDMFVAKYDPNGNHIWSKRFGGVNHANASSLSVDGSGNVFVVGGFAGTADFGGGPLTSVPLGATDIFVAGMLKVSTVGA